MPDFSKVRYVVLDVDGTMTDGGIYYDSEGNESKRFDVKDGLGIKAGIAAGLEFLIITGRESPIVERRAKELGIQNLMSGIQLKYQEMSKWMKNNSISAEEVCYIGDDWNDLECMKAAGVSMCPVDAVEEVRVASDYVSSALAGHGAVRECIEAILKAKGEWEGARERLYIS